METSTPIDYRLLLKKYMQVVVACEGVTFAPSHPAQGNGVDSPSFNEAEISALKEIDENLYD